MRKLFAIFLLLALCMVVLTGEKRIVGARVNNQLMLLRIDLANYAMDCSVDGTSWNAVRLDWSNVLNASGMAMLTGAAFTGNVSVAGTFTASGTLVVPNNAFSLSKLAQVSAGSVLGNVSGSTGNVSVLTASELKTLIGNATASVVGLMSAADKSKLDGLSTVATSGSYSDLSGKPTVATNSVAGFMSGTDKTKLDGLVSGYRGYYATESALKAAHATGTNGDYALIGETGTVWAWIGSAWTNTSITSLSWSAVTGKPTFATVATSGSYGDLSGKPAIPSRAVQYYTGTVADDGTITLDNSVAVSALAIGDLVRITSANATLGIAIGDLYRKNADSATVTVPDPSKVNVLGNYSGSGTYIHWNPYTLQSGTGSSRIWMSSNGTYWVGYRQIGGYNGWQIYYMYMVYASAIDDGTHDPWDSSLTWVTDTGASGSTNIHVGEGTSDQTVTNNIVQFKKVMDATLTALTVPYLDASKNLTSSTVTPTELGYLSGVTSAVQTQMNGLEELTKTVSVNPQTGTSYTLVLADRGKLVTISNASANTLTIPLNSSLAYPTGTWIDVVNIGAGACTVTAISGVTLNGTDGGTKAISQWSGTRLYKIASDTWVAR